MQAIAADNQEKEWCIEYMVNTLRNKVIAMNMKLSWMQRGVINENTSFGEIMANTQLMRLTAQYLSCGLSERIDESNYSKGLLSDFHLFAATQQVLEQKFAGNPEQLAIAVAGRKKLDRFIKKTRERLVLEMDLDGTEEAVEEKKRVAKEKRDAAAAKKADKALQQVLTETAAERAQMVDEGFGNLIDDEAEESDCDDDDSEPTISTSAKKKKAELVRELEDARKQLEDLKSKETAKEKRQERGEKNSKNDTDYYQELPSVVHAIEPSLRATPNLKIVYDPCCGLGRLASILSVFGYTVLETDKNAVDPSKKFDYLRREFKEAYDIMITFPPIRLKYQFLKRACLLGMPFLMLMPAKILSHQDSVLLFKEYGLSVGVLVPVPKFISPIDNKVKVCGDMVWVSFGGVKQEKPKIVLSFINHNEHLNTPFMPVDNDEDSVHFVLHQVYKETEKPNYEPDDAVEDAVEDDAVSAISSVTNSRKHDYGFPEDDVFSRVEWDKTLGQSTKRVAKFPTPNLTPIGYDDSANLNPQRFHPPAEFLRGASDYDKYKHWFDKYSKLLPSEQLKLRAHEYTKSFADHEKTKDIPFEDILNSDGYFLWPINFVRRLLHENLIDTTDIDAAAGVTNDCNSMEIEKDDNDLDL